VLRALVVAGVTLSLLAGGELALQATSLGRPAAAELELVRTLHALAGLHRSQAMVELNGRTYRSTCTQAWYPHRRIAQVVAGRLGVVTQVGNRLEAAGPLATGAFELAGCPRPLLRWLSSELIQGATVHIRRGASVYEITLRPHTLPVQLFVAPSTGLPVRLTLNEPNLDGSSHVRYGTLG
jgi:hypothetical protein